MKEIEINDDYSVLFANVNGKLTAYLNDADASAIVEVVWNKATLEVEDYKLEDIALSIPSVITNLLLLHCGNHYGWGFMEEEILQLDELPQKKVLVDNDVYTITAHCDSTRGYNFF